MSKDFDEYLKSLVIDTLTEEQKIELARRILSIRNYYPAEASFLTTKKDK